MFSFWALAIVCGVYTTVLCIPNVLFGSPLLECSEVSVDEKALEKVMEGLTIPNARGIHDDSAKTHKEWPEVLVYVQVQCYLYSCNSGRDLLVLIFFQLKFPQWHRTLASLYLSDLRSVLIAYKVLTTCLLKLTKYAHSHSISSDQAQKTVLVVNNMSAHTAAIFNCY